MTPLMKFFVVLVLSTGPVYLILNSYENENVTKEKLKYFFHPKCSCHRSAEYKFSSAYVNSLDPSSKLSSIPVGTYVGPSSCNEFTSALGSGQKVLSYAYFTPWNKEEKQFYRDDRGAPSDNFAPRYYDLLEPLAVNISKLYPGWRMRIYHNITEDDEVFPHMCDLYCNHPHVDTCDMRHHPTEGDLQDRFPAGMMWRFLPMGDPTVSKFLSRDLDAGLFQRERAAVKRWEDSNYQFHFMRDLPNHNTEILGGLWGANVYMNISRTISMITDMYAMGPDGRRGADQIIIAKVIWPSAREDALIHDSYHCMPWHKKKFGEVQPYPTQREGSYWIGYGPVRDIKLDRLDKKRMLRCPKQCRPPDHQDWENC